ncbi:hypothetical protein [Stappia sp.]|uniref:hypothetical protein n=1 Tax=Stappia sp. TaxID=1870903 RepID=UPI003C7DAE70
MATQEAGRDRIAVAKDTGDVEPLTADEIRAALQRLLSAPALARAPKISRLLAYLVNVHLDATPDALSEPVIAGAVFDQRDGFNPRSNPIVRVNASRLRNVLRKHFAGDGAAEPVHIHLANVGYSLEIRRKPPSSDSSSGRAQVPAAAQANQTVSRSAASDTSVPPLPPAADVASPPSAEQPAAAFVATLAYLKQKLCAPVSLGVVIALLIAVSLLNIAYTHLVHTTMLLPDPPSPVASVAVLRN